MKITDAAEAVNISDLRVWTERPRIIADRRIQRVRHLKAVSPLEMLPFGRTFGHDALEGEGESVLPGSGKRKNRLFAGLEFTVIVLPRVAL